MDSTCRKIVTTSGTSEPQGSAVVRGFGVKAGSNVAGPVRPSSHERESAGVASQAPAILLTTRSESAMSSPGKRDTEEKKHESNGQGLKEKLIDTQFRSFPTGSLQSAAALMSREKAERAYQIALEDSMKSLERLEAKISQATNTKMSIKESAKALGISFRDLIKKSKVIGMEWSPDAVTQKLREV
ncbi:unnamed protein product [Aphis gossypii]|uniref:Uncharacterized protein n=1 Tax=Aphis gossypii TaxID=80765 RepID=A0A9P0NMV2_APHGO|nr:unnamed protein product [Aphis gossypii]